MSSKAVPIEEQITFGPLAEVAPAPSPDGRWLLFEYFHPEHPEMPALWVMPMKGTFSEARPLVDDGTYNGEPSWSPDGQWLCYQKLSQLGKSNSLFRINIKTGENIQITELPQASAVGDSTTWSVTGKIAFELGGDIYALDPENGAMTKLLDSRKVPRSARPAHLVWSPDGTRLAFATENEETLRSAVWVLDVKTSRLRLVIDKHIDTFPAWFGSDRLMFARMLTKDSARIGVVSSSGGTPTWVTQGHEDLTPAAASGGLVFFARAAGSKPVSNSLNIFAGFHIWRTTKTH